MSEKSSEDAVLAISYQLFDKYVPRTDYHPATDLSKTEDQTQYVRLLADSFANFHLFTQSSLALHGLQRAHSADQCCFRTVTLPVESLGCDE